MRACPCAPLELSLIDFSASRSGRATGIVFILSGSVYYVYTKAQEQNAPRPVR